MLCRIGLLSLEAHGDLATGIPLTLAWLLCPCSDSSSPSSFAWLLHRQPVSASGWTLRTFLTDTRGAPSPQSFLVVAQTSPSQWGRSWLSRQDCALSPHPIPSSIFRLPLLLLPSLGTWWYVLYFILIIIPQKRKQFLSLMFTTVSQMPDSVLNKYLVDKREWIRLLPEEALYYNGYKDW